MYLAAYMPLCGILLSKEEECSSGSIYQFLEGWPVSRIVVVKVWEQGGWSSGGLLRSISGSRACSWWAGSKFPSVR